MREIRKGDEKMPVRIQKTKFYVVWEICEILHLTRETVVKYIHQGRIHAIKIGSSWHISQESLNEFLKTGGVIGVKEVERYVPEGTEKRGSSINSRSNLRNYKS